MKKNEKTKLGGGSWSENKGKKSARLMISRGLHEPALSFARGRESEGGLEEEREEGRPGRDGAG